MKMKKGILILIIVLSVLTSCEKESPLSDSDLIGEWNAENINNQTGNSSFSVYNFKDNGIYEVKRGGNTYLSTWLIDDNGNLVIEDGYNTLTTATDQPSFKHYYWKIYGTLHYHLKLTKKY